MPSMGCEAVGRWAVSSASTSRAAPPAHAPRSQPAMALRASQGSLWPEERHRLPSMSPATVVRQSRCRSSAPSGVKGSSPDDSGASETGETLNCQPGLATLGFVGMGIMGVPMALNLVKAGYKVVVWNRSPERCEPLLEAGATRAATPADVARQSDVVFGMLADPFAAYTVSCLKDGVAEGMSPGKGYIDVDAVTVMRISDRIRSAGGQYLEAPVSGSKGPAEQGQLIFLAAGDEELFERVQHPLEVMGKASFYLGQDGAGANMKLVVNMVMGTMMASLAEGLTLAKKAGMSQRDVLEVISLGAMSCPMFSLKGPAMVEGNFPPAFPLKHQHKDIRLAMELANEVDAKLPLADAASLMYRKAANMNLGDEDFSAILKAVELDESKLFDRPFFLEEEDQ